MRRLFKKSLQAAIMNLHDRLEMARWMVRGKGKAQYGHTNGPLIQELLEFEEEVRWLENEEYKRALNNAPKWSSSDDNDNYDGDNDNYDDKDGVPVVSVPATSKDDNAPATNKDNDALAVGKDDDVPAINKDDGQRQQ